LKNSLDLGKSNNWKSNYWLINEIVRALYDKLIVGEIASDLAKAFDCVNQDILLPKLNCYGITGKGNGWMKVYLRNSCQRGEIKIYFDHNTFSNCGIIKHSVRQGSIVDPSLFLIYLKAVNGKSKSVFFSDNSSIIFTNSISKVFKNDLFIECESLHKWFKSN
jgi:hypothetical protein